MMSVPRRKHLYLVAALLWGVPGVHITVKGLLSYMRLDSHCVWLLLFLTAIVAVGFFFMFRRIVARYASRIESLPASEIALLNTFPRRGWLLMFFMMGLGALVKLLPGVPVGFVAAFYSGLGPMLLFSSARFALRAG